MVGIIAVGDQRRNGVQGGDRRAVTTHGMMVADGVDAAHGVCFAGFFVSRRAKPAATTARTSPLPVRLPVRQGAGIVEIIPTTDPTEFALSR
jgi:hypothetical protein